MERFVSASIADTIGGSKEAVTDCTVLAPELGELAGRGTHTPLLNRLP